ncbi:DDE_Tnp_1_7 domain-containing protein [Trichonephila clavata]|uniref:DDE_Tnp_1_7 domain-containing protein n=1 Tax=Trichonephila clavata TaxID=2740835 RepID=A0A8X6KP29_TRICU|nr:DDE_Tnp_1_7 domain-containing protein [Trichonephila clavata]
MLERFRGENFWGRPETIRELLKELIKDENFISEDESENEDSYFVEELSRSIQGSNRNMTMNNWFTSILLDDKLVKIPMHFTVVGSIRENKQEILPELLELRSRSVGTSMYYFDQVKTLLSYKKCVFLLSTFHEKPNINEESGKPEIIEFYNATKGAVDILDQM